MLGSLFRFIINVLVTAAALWVVILLVDGVTLTVPETPMVGDGSNDELWVFLAVSAIIVILNATVKPILKLLGLPITILTLGLFALVINALIFLLAETVSGWFGLGLHITSFGAAFVGAIILGVVTWILGVITGSITGVLGGARER